MQQEFRQKEATWCWRKRSKIYQISLPVFHVYFTLDYDFFVLSSWSLIKQGLTEVASQINQHCCLQGGWTVGRCLPSPRACRALRAEDFLPCFACWVSMLACRALKYKFLFSYKNRCCYYTENGQFFPLPVNCSQFIKYKILIFLMPVMMIYIWFIKCDSAWECPAHWEDMLCTNSWRTFFSCKKAIILCRNRRVLNALYLRNVSPHQLPA